MHAYTKCVRIILDIIAPHRCCGCGRLHTTLCTDCRATIPQRTQTTCPLCHVTTTKTGYCCASCRITHKIDGIIIAHPRHTLLRHAIYQYKYRMVRDLSMPLATCMIESINRSLCPIPDLIVPVPLHSRRLRWRGFDHVASLAHIVARALLPQMPLPCASVLYRTRYTTPQAKQPDRAARMANCQNLFAVATQEKIVAGRTILLVDDVMTSGSTLCACAHTLKDAGAKAVYGVVLVRD